MLSDSYRTDFKPKFSNTIHIAVVISDDDCEIIGWQIFNPQLCSFKTPLLIMSAFQHLLNQEIYESLGIVTADPLRWNLVTFQLQIGHEDYAHSISRYTKSRCTTTKLLFINPSSPSSSSSQSLQSVVFSTGPPPHRAHRKKRKIMAASFLRPSNFGTQDHKYLTSRFSSYPRPARLAALWLLDMREMRKIEQLILHGSDETVMAFKGSQIGAVGMTAVAVRMVF